MVRLTPLIALAATLLAIAPAEARAKKGCALRGATVVLQNKDAVVPSHVVSDGIGQRADYWGCVRSKKRLVFIASSGGDSQFGGWTLDRILLHGTFVARSGWSRTGDGAGYCSATVHVHSLVGRRLKSGWGAEGYGPDCPHVSALVLGPRARAAFVGNDGSSGDALWKLDATGRHVVDRGEIDPESLQITGSELRWTNAGRARSHRVY
jgi:hypothetical protein